MSALRAPFPYFGGKSRAAHLVWEALGDVANYVEPFFGSGAVLLARPGEPGIETVNDINAHIANFWRSIRSAPDEVARWADWPVNETDLHARHLWLVNPGESVEFRERMVADPEHFDAKRAGWWVWGASAWIGSGWCTSEGGRTEPTTSRAQLGPRRPPIQLPHLSTSGCGTHRESFRASGGARHPARQVARFQDCRLRARASTGPRPGVPLTRNSDASPSASARCAWRAATGSES